MPRSRSAVIAVATALTALFAVPARSALLGHWDFDGCTLTDASGNSQSLSSVGSPTCVPGRFGNAWQFNGSSQCLERTSAGLFTPGTRPWTVAVWVKSTRADTFQYAVDWYRCGANPLCSTPDAALFAIGLDHGRPFWNIRDDDSHLYMLTDSTLALADGGWHHIVGVMNSASDSAKLFVDGGLRKVVTGPMTTWNAGGFSVPLEVGRHYILGWGVPSYYFFGAIDEVRIYDEALAAPNVAQIFSQNVGVETESALEIAMSVPNPARAGRLRVVFTLPVADDAEVAMYDIGGRRVARLTGTRGAGRHDVELRGAHPLAPGVYLVRVQQGAHQATRQVSVLE